MTLAAPLSRHQEPAQKASEPAAPLTNKDVVDMVKSGLPADVIVAKIKSSPAKFDTAPAALGDLKTAGVPDPVILAISI